MLKPFVSYIAIKSSDSLTGGLHTDLMVTVIDPDRDDDGYERSYLGCIPNKPSIHDIILTFKSIASSLEQERLRGKEGAT